MLLVKPQGLVTIHVNILSMYKHVYVYTLTVYLPLTVYLRG